MDNLTHSLFALTLAQTPLRRAGRGTALTLVLASNAPDSDIVVAMTGGSAAYLTAHRGSSHGLLAIAGLAIAVAALVYGVLRKWEWTSFSDDAVKMGPVPISADASFRSLVAVALVGTVCHVLMDLPTPYGTRWLSPFDRTWYSFDWMPIIDVYLWGLLAIGLIAVWIKPARRMRIASIVLLLMLGNYGLRAGIQTAVLRRATASGPVPPTILVSWPDRPSPKLPSDHPCFEEPCALATAAQPTFFSPFRWLIIRQFSNGYRFSVVDFFAPDQSPADFLQDDEGPAVDVAREAPAPRALLAFSRFPAAYVEQRGQDTIVQFYDVRFRQGRIPPAEGSFRRGGLFNAIVRVGPYGKVLED